ncbi:MAG: hypothetical protein ACTSWY_01120 [Promethearchaeota archaeon]
MPKTSYYRYQSPGRSAFWFFVLSFVLILPGASMNILESIIRSSMGDGSVHPLFLPVPFLSIFFIFCLIFKKKHPRTVTVLCNSLMLILFALNMFYLALSITQFLGNMIIDISQINEEIGIRGITSIFSFLATFRVISRTKQSFADCEPENDATIIALWTIIILIHVFAIILSILVFFNDELQLKEVPDFSGAGGYLSMLGFLIYLFPGIFILKLALSAYKSIKSFRKETKKSSTLKTTIFILIFIFAWVPVLGHFVDHGINTRNHSIYNPTWSGNSEFKTIIQNEGYETFGIQSSLSALIRMNRSVCLVIFGPTASYNPLSEVPFFIDMLSNTDLDFSMLICDDHGSTTALMMELFISAPLSGTSVPLALFPNGILWDNESYLDDTNPQFPIIQVDSSHETATDVHQVVLSMASCILMGDLFGWSTVGTSSAQYSFIDKTGPDGVPDGRYDYEYDNFPVPDMVKDFIPSFEHGLPLGGYPQVVFAYKEMSAKNRIFITADASMFNNELINSHDNKQFARNIINWLTGGDKSIAVVFDESHNIPLGTVEFSSASVFGMFQGYVNWLSTNPFLSWIYPLWAIRTLSRWVPKKGDKKKEKKKEEKESKEEIQELKFRTSSFFAKKINWYRLNKKYNQALILLFRRIERKLNKLIGGVKLTVNNIIAEIKARRGKYINKESINRMQRFLEKMLQVKKNQINIVDEEEFNDMFFEMEWFSNII